MLKIGSLCTGYGGLDMAVEAYFAAQTVWTSDIDKYASIVIKERINKPNLGDLKQIDWTQVEPIDILTAGYPCQPFSHAGQRKGTQDERHIFPYIMQAISVLRPRIVVLENVRGHLTLGFKEVLKELAEAGYDAKWRIVRASDAGAPHRRERLFIIAQPTDTDGIRGQFRINDAQWHQGQSQFEPCKCGEVITDANSCSCEESRRANRSIYGTPSEVVHRSDWDVDRSRGSLITDTTSDGFQDRSQSVRHESGSEIDSNTNNEHQSHNRQVQEFRGRFASRCEMRLRRAPHPLDINDKLNAKFVEYMMGLPEGWVTDLPLSRSQQLKILGNGVVPQQAYLALQLLLGKPNVDNTSL
jgi:DNA (cytosine-5)-methyltransferase 1